MRRSSSTMRTGRVVPGFTGDPAKFDLTVRFTQWMFPYLILVSLVAWAMGILNTEKRFAAAAMPHLDDLFRTALRVIGDRERAEDLVQETYLQAWKSFHRFVRLAIGCGRVEIDQPELARRLAAAQ